MTASTTPPSHPSLTVFDTHCHLGMGRGENEESAAAIHQRALDAGVRCMLDVGIDLASSLGARERARTFAGVYYTAGLHPNHSDQLQQEWPELRSLFAEEDCRALGETGLDFYRDNVSHDQQLLAFRAHLQLALQLNKPVVIHCRDAFPRTFEVLEEFKGTRGVMHCFSGGVPEAQKALDLGLHLSFAGPLTYPRSQPLRDAAAYAPADRILVETDAPFLPPQGRRGQRNEPAYVLMTLQTLADLRGVSLGEMAAITTANGKRLFGIAD